MNSIITCYPNYYFNKNPLRINFGLTNFCNYSCSYCPEHLHTGKQNNFTLDELIKFFKELKDQPNFRKRDIIVEFSGGEVTALKYFEELIAELKENKYYITVITNLSKPLRYFEKNIKNIDTILCSYHHEFVKNRQNYFLDKLIYLNDACGLKVFCNYIVTPNHYDDIYKFATKANEMTPRIYHSLCQVLDQLERVNNDKYPFSDDQLRQMKEFNWKKTKPEIKLQRLISIVTSCLKAKSLFPVAQNPTGVTIKMDNGQSQKYHVHNLIMHKKNSFTNMHCMAGIDSIVINEKGNIFRGWCLEGGEIGNIKLSHKPIDVNPIKCKKEFCHCPFDINTKKYLKA